MSRSGLTYGGRAKPCSYLGERRRGMLGTPD
jgi:hypothetical protein